LAKREEEVYRPGAAEPLRLSRHAAALRLLQYVRDEATASPSTTTTSSAARNCRETTDLPPKGRAGSVSDRSRPPVAHTPASPPSSTRPPLARPHPTRSWGTVSRPCPGTDRTSPLGKPGDLRSAEGNGRETVPQPPLPGFTSPTPHPESVQAAVAESERA